MSTQEPKLEELLEYPANFTFRVVADHHDGLHTLCVQTVEEFLGRPCIQSELKPSKKGTFSSVRITTVVLTADEIRGTYALIKERVSGIRMLL